MSVPLTKKLSHAWAKATNQARLYSRVFEVTDSSQVTYVNNIHIFFPGAASSADIPLTYDTTKTTRYLTWLEAHPAKGQDGQYFLHQYEHGKGHHAKYVDKKPRSLESAIKAISEQEKRWSASGATLAKRQPFTALKAPAR